MHDVVNQVTNMRNFSWQNGLRDTESCIIVSYVMASLPPRPLRMLVPLVSMSSSSSLGTNRVVTVGSNGDTRCLP